MYPIRSLSTWSNPISFELFIFYNVRIIIKYDCGHYGIIYQRRICFEYKRDQIKKGIQANGEKAELKGGMWILREKRGTQIYLLHCSKSKTQITVKKTFTFTLTVVALHKLYWKSAQRSKIEK